MNGREPVVAIAGSRRRYEHGFGDGTRLRQLGCVTGPFQLLAISKKRLAAKGSLIK